MNAYYTDEVHGKHEYYDLGGFPLRSGYTLPEAGIAYKTHGTLNAAKDNAVLFPHMYSGTSASMEIFIGEGRPLDPSKYFIILPGQFGGGFSSSPSNTPAPYDRGQFPPLAIADDVIAQHRLVTEHFGISTLHAVLGWSMGAQQTYEWAVRFPEMVPRGAVFAGNGRTPVHNQVFIDLHTELLTSDPEFKDGFYSDSADLRLALKRHAVAFSLMGFSAAFYRDELWRSLGFVSSNDFRQGFLRGYFAPMDPNNLLAQASKWRAGDISDHTGGDVAAALGRITAQFFVASFSEDLFFPPEDHDADCAHIPNGHRRPIETPMGHFGMFCLREEDQAAVDAVIAEMLDA
ncbi:homoserine O-acetyltransferase [Pseudonocardia sediminis]|uniref:Homoserine O-acetyltransferase n=1 Tax=Pseudonocardia sediminis TaxID=1397368 RepID=A0A4Q7UU09_PSEST|nr:alpha/beta fold hydrolase [Pseudonocardia sediminis]RZT84291.1 homoserine O-acetyltransferase [Pseudonocardia sediminis]